MPYGEQVNHRMKKMTKVENHLVAVGGHAYCVNTIHQTTAVPRSPTASITLEARQRNVERGCTVAARLAPGSCVCTRKRADSLGSSQVFELTTLGMNIDSTGVSGASKQGQLEGKEMKTMLSTGGWKRLC